MRGIIFFQFFQAVKMAGHAILSNKLRSFLTMLGIIIGIGSVISIVSIQHGQRPLDGQYIG